MKLWAVFIVFLIGIGLGAASIVYGPTVLDPYLPAAIRARFQTATIEGTVKAKRREGDRLLLRIEAPQGAIVATFKEKTPEIDLLIGEGDRVTLALRAYKPFVEDPSIQRVRKQELAKPNQNLPPSTPTEPKGNPKAK